VDAGSLEGVRMRSVGSDVDTEDLAAEWPILSLANNAEDVKVLVVTCCDWY
jgi:hypothetical protein